MADPNQKEYASSFTIIQIALYKVTDESKPYINLKSMVTSFQYHEDIFWPCFGATMLVVDNSENLISSMPIQGWEKVVVEVEDVLGERYSYDFRLWQISNRVNKERKQMYSLGLISEEGLRNEGIQINSLQEGQTSTQVQKILEEKLRVPTEKIFVEPSMTKLKTIPTRQSPFSFIKSLLSKTISQKTGAANIAAETGSSSSSGTDKSTDTDIETAEKAKGTAGYLFFQTRKGFTFKSIDKLVSSGGEDDNFEGSPPVTKPFFYQAAKIGKPSMFRIQEIVYGQEIDMIKAMRKGAYTSLICFFNINTHQYEERVYSLAEQWKDMAHMGSVEDLPIGQSELSKYPSRIMSSILNHENWYGESHVASDEPRHGGDSSNQFPDWQKMYLSQSLSRVGVLFNQQLNISLTGHLDLCAGDKIEIRIPENKEEEKKEQTWDQENSGTYLIKNLNHQFLMGASPSVYTVLELIRDSYGIKGQTSKVK